MLSGLDVILKAFVLTCVATFTMSADAITKKKIAAAQCLPAVLSRGAVTQAEQRENSLWSLCADVMMAEMLINARSPCY